MSLYGWNYFPGAAMPAAGEYQVACLPGPTVEMADWDGENWSVRGDWCADPPSPYAFRSVSPPPAPVAILCEEVATPVPFLNFAGKPPASVEEALNAVDALERELLRRSEYLARHPEILEEMAGGVQVAGGFIGGGKP